MSESPSPTNKTFYPDNPLYIVICALVALVVPWAPIYRLQFDYKVIVAYVLFLGFVSYVFFFMVRLEIRGDVVWGPLLSVWRGKIALKEAEFFFDEVILGNRHIIIRHKHSGRQIQIPSLFFTASTKEEIRKIFLSRALPAPGAQV